MQEAEPEQVEILAEPVRRTLSVDGRVVEHSHHIEPSDRRSSAIKPVEESLDACVALQGFAMRSER